MDIQKSVNEQPSVDDNDFNFETMDIKSVYTLSFVLWALGFVKTKDPIKEGDDMNYPGEEEIKKRYATPGNHPDDVAIHYYPCWGNTFFRLSVKDAAGVYQPLASIETSMPTCDMCSRGCHIDVYLICRRTNLMIEHTIHFDEEIYSGDPHIITDVYYDENPCSLEDNFYNYMFRKDDSRKQIVPAEPVDVEWLPEYVEVAP
jgi:hypothetical protein